MEEHGLSLEQIVWRRWKIEEDFSGNLELFRQEYPLTPEEAFVTSGNPVFRDVELFEEDFTFETVYGWEEFFVKAGHPKEGWRYVFGVDPAGGTGGDFSAVVGVGVSPEKEVQLALVAQDRFIQPSSLGKFLTDLGRSWGDAYLVVERNSMGLSVLEKLMEERYPTHLIWREFVKRRDKFGKTIKALEFGFYSGRKKGYLVSCGQDLLKVLGGVWHDGLYTQLQEFSEVNGKLLGSGDHDDLVIAFCLAGLGLKKIRPGVVKVKRSVEKQRREPRPFAVRWEDIFKRPVEGPWIFVGEGS